MQIFTITSKNPKEFTDSVNIYLRGGWKLHGEPHISTVAELKSLGGVQYSDSITTYVQILKKD